MTTLGIDSLRALLAVVDAGGFTAAGERLGRTQSAVSMQIRTLEGTVGRPLLTRARGGPVPTPEGELLLGFARRLLALHDEAVQALAGDLAAGTVRLGTPDDYAAALLPPSLQRFASLHPRVRLEIRCALSAELEADLAAGRLDLAMVTRRPGDAGGALLRREPLVWCAAPGHRPELVDPLPLALFPDRCLFRAPALGALDRAGLGWRLAFVSGSLAGIQSAVGCGLALTCLAAGTVPRGWRVLGPADGLPPLPTVEIALKAAQPLTPAARRLADHLRSSMERGVAEAA